MKELIIKGHKVKVYDAIDELPMERYHKYNKYLLIDSGIGSNLTDIDQHLAKATAYIRNKDEANAVRVLENLRQGLYFVGNGINPELLSFAVLVAEIDGVKQFDISDTRLQEITEIFKQEKKRWFNDNFESLKKKIDSELHVYFKEIFETPSVKQYYDIIKRRALYILQGIREDSDQSDNIQHSDDELLMFFKPKPFANGQAEIEYDKNYENLCLIISQHTNKDVKKLSVLEFYTAYQFVKKLTTEKQKQHGKRK